jgi:hypothetical protein
MQFRNLPKLEKGTRVRVACWMIGRHYGSGRNYDDVVEGWVMHVTPNGGILVSIGDTDQKWFPYHGVRVIGTHDDEPR